MASTITLDRAGDAVLAISGAQKRDPRYEVQVSTNVLKLASPVFKAMFSHNFKEHQSLREAADREAIARIEFVEDFPEAMVHILSILHLGHAFSEADDDEDECEEDDDNDDDAYCTESDGEYDPEAEGASEVESDGSQHLKKHVEFVARVVIQADKYNCAKRIELWKAEQIEEILADDDPFWSSKPLVEEKAHLMIIARLSPDISTSTGLYNFLLRHTAPNFTIGCRNGRLLEWFCPDFLSTILKQVKDVVDEMRSTIRLALKELDSIAEWSDDEDDFDDYRWLWDDYEDGDQTSDEESQIRDNKCQVKERKPKNTQDECKNALLPQRFRTCFVRARLKALLTESPEAAYRLTPHTIASRAQKAHRKFEKWEHSCSREPCPLVRLMDAVAIDLTIKDGPNGISAPATRVQSYLDWCHDEYRWGDVWEMIEERRQSWM